MIFEWGICRETSSLLAKQLLRLDQKTVPLEDEQNLDVLTTGGAVVGRQAREITPLEGETRHRSLEKGKPGAHNMF